MKINFKELSKYDNIAVVTHTRPDGDAIGSSIGIYYGFLACGKEIDLLCDMDVPNKMKFLWGAKKFKKTVDKKYDLVIFSDCGDISRIGDLPIKLNRAKTVCIDHHETRNAFCDINLIVPSSASTCELVLEILMENGIPLNESIANVLYTGLMTDTGNFAHTNVIADTFRHAEILTRNGANPNMLTRRIFKLLEGNKYKLIAKVLSEVKLYDSGRVAYYYLSKKSLEELGLTAVATEGVIDNALSIEGVQIAISVLEHKENTYKVSLRSIDGIEVNRVAESFGGGGHKQAAGCTACGYYEDIKEKLIRTASLYTNE